METLSQGNLYAININRGSFRLLRLTGQWLGSRRVETPDSLSRQLRSSYPGENVGWAWYADTYQEDGWYRLEIRIDGDAPFPDVVKARAAGFVEGNLQGSHMYNYWTNYRVNQYRGHGEAPSRELYDFLDEQYGWMVRKVEAATGWGTAVLRGEAAAAAVPAGGGGGSGGGTRSLKGDSGGGSGAAASGGSAGGEFDKRYWTLVGLVAAQFEGLAAGFWAGVTDPARNMTWNELYTLNALGDLYELNVLFPPGEEPEVEAEAAAAAEAAVETAAAAGQRRPRPRPRQYSPGHGEVGEYGYGELLDCSAIIKVDFGDDGDGGGGGGGEGRGGGDDDGGDGGDGGDDGDGDGDGGGDDGSGDDGSGDDGSGDEGGDDDDRGAGGMGGAAGTAGGGRGGLVLGRRGAAAGAATAAAAEGSGSAPARRRSLRQQEQQQYPQQLLKLQRRRPPRRRVRNFWAAHNTWRSYFEMVRTWKVFDLPWAASGPLTISSSPGLLHSKDDWYTTDKFVVMETTNGIYNKALYDLIQPRCVLMWQRAQIANFGARSGSEWADLFERFNSGTYNNQWMVLDVPRLEAGRRSGVLWVLEQVPGTTVSRDVSQVLLDRGYWASYNVPYFPEIYNLTGYPQPSIYSTCPRAQIFSREQGRLASRTDVQSLMRLNRYQDDPLSGGMPNAAIAARYDLPALPDASGVPRNWTRRAYGAVDAKVVDSESFHQRRTHVVNGPTNEDQAAFSWSAEPLFESVRHEGLPDAFKFGWHAYQTVMGPPLAAVEAVR